MRTKRNENNKKRNYVKKNKGEDEGRIKTTRAQLPL